MTDDDPGTARLPADALDAVPLLICDPAGGTVYASPGARRLGGIGLADAPVTVDRLVHPPDAESVAAAFLDALETGTETRVAFRRRSAPRDRPLLATLIPLPAAHGSTTAAGLDAASRPDASTRFDADAAVLVHLREATAADRLGRVLEDLGDPRGRMATADSREDVVRDVLDRTGSVDDLTLRFYLRGEASVTLEPVPGDPASAGGVPAAVRAADRTGRVTVLDDAALERLSPVGSTPTAAVALPLGDHGVLVAGVARSTDLSPALSSSLRRLVATVALSLDRLVLRRRAGRSAAELERLRAETDRFTDVVRAVRGAVRRVVDAASTDEVHRAVCEELATLASVGVVWYGSVVPEAGTVVPEASAGGARPPLDRIGIDAGGTESIPPVVEAVTEGEPVAVPDVTAGYSTENWRREALSRGLRSVLVVPVTDGEAVRGVVAVYGREAGGLGGPLGDGLVHLVRVVSHALDAIEVETALGETTVGFVLSVPDDASPLARLATAAGCTLGVRDVTATPDGRTRVYVTADAPPETVAAAAERVAGLGDLTPLGERGEDTLYGVVVSGRTVPATVASLGATLVAARTDGESVRVTVALPRSADVDGFLESARAVYPGTELLGRRPRDRLFETASGFRTAVEGRITGRQREALGAVYFSGYFEWPRELNGSEVAATLGVSQPTFARHLRAAQRTLLSLMFESDARD